MGPLSTLVCLALILAGGLIVRRAWWPARVGEAPHCRRCEYPLTDGGDACPECGSTDTPHIGRRDRSSGRAAVGLVLLALGLLGAGVPWAVDAAGIDWYQRTPTWYVLRDATGRRSFDAWEELARRDQASKLSAEEFDAWVASVQSTADKGRLHHQAVDLLQAWNDAGRLAQAQLEAAVQRAWLSLDEDADHDTMAEKKWRGLLLSAAATDSLRAGDLDRLDERALVACEPDARLDDREIADYQQHLVNRYQAGRMTDPERQRLLDLAIRNIGAGRDALASTYLRYRWAEWVLAPAAAQGHLTSAEATRLAEAMIPIRISVRPRTGLGMPVRYQVELGEHVPGPFWLKRDWHELAIDGVTAARHEGVPEGMRESWASGTLPDVSPGMHRLDARFAVRLMHGPPKDAERSTPVASIEVSGSAPFEVLRDVDHVAPRDVAAHHAGVVDAMRPTVRRSRFAGILEVIFFDTPGAGGRLPMPVAFEVFVRDAAGAEQRICEVVYAPGDDGREHNRTGPGSAFFPGEPPAAVDVILRPDAEAARQSMHVRDYWTGPEIVYEHVSVQPAR